MISKRNNKAFTLAEIMIVLLILTILFALLAPMFAKKMTKDKGSVWNWVDTNSTYSAYFDGDYESDHNLLSEAFFGMAPDSESSAEYDPYSKIVLRAYDHRGKVQKHINFRYGYEPIENAYDHIENAFTNDDKEQIKSIGNNVGTMLLDTQNILVGGSYDYMYATAQNRTIPLRNNSSATRHFSLYPTNNITFGNEAKDDIVRKTFTRYQEPVEDEVNGQPRYHYNIYSTPEISSNNNNDFRETRSVGNIAIGFRAGKNDSRARANNQDYSSFDDNFNKFGYNYTDNIYIGYKAGYISDFGPNGNNEADPIYYTPYIPKDSSGIKYPEIIGQTIIGSNAGLNNMGILNTIIGSNAGKNFRGTNNVFIGSNAGGFADFVGLDDSEDSVQWEEVSNNVAIGYNALHSLRAFTDLGELKSTPYNEEVGCLPEEDRLGDRCVMRKEIYKHYNNNIAIGAYALENLEAGYNNVAIGYKACSNLKHSANKICIGANSGPGYDRGVTRFFESFKNADGKNHYITPTQKETEDTHLYDITQRIYIGSQPKHFGGDAVLEIHDSNVQYGAGNLKSFLMNEPTISRANTTTIVNGNLVVRGKVFFTVGDNLYNFSTVGYKPTETPPAGPGPRPRYPFDEQDYYILGSTVNEGSIVCAANPLTYTFGGVYNNGVYYSDNFSLGCPRVFYNQDQFDEIPDDYNDFTVTHDDTPVALGYKYLEKTYETPSDRRLKNIGSKSKAGLAEIMKLKVFNYKYKDDEKKIPHVGVIAQDLMKIFPNSVITGKDGFLSIKLEEMFYAAINAIKDLDKIIVSHTKRVLKLESTISKLEAENADLKSQVEALTTRVNKIKASRRL